MKQLERAYVTAKQFQHSRRKVQNLRIKFTKLRF